MKYLHRNSIGKEDVSDFKGDTASFNAYSGVPNKSAAHLLIQEIFSFQHALIRSNMFIKSYKNFLPICLFGANH